MDEVEKDEYYDSKANHIYTELEYKLSQEEEVEQFLCCLGYRDELFNLFLKKGLNSIDKLFLIEKYNFSKTVLADSKKEMILINICLVFENINFYCPKIENDIENNQIIKNDEAKPNIIWIIKNTTYNLKSSPLTREGMINSFKLKNKPNNSLPKDFKSENITAEKLYASFLQDKKIGIISDLSEFKNLRHLYLNNNRIQKLENLNFPNLIILELSNNFVKKIENLENLKILQTLNLEKNLINTLENIEENIFLENLNLSKQMLTRSEIFNINFDNDFKNTNLLNLSLENCNLLDPTKLSSFYSLKKLNVSKNKINELSLLIEGLKAMYELEYLLVSGNPFMNYPESKSYRDVIVLRCPNILELDNKTISNNEKMYVNSLYSRKFGPKSGKIKSTEQVNSQGVNNKLNLNAKRKVHLSVISKKLNHNSIEELKRREKNGQMQNKNYI